MKTIFKILIMGIGITTMSHTQTSEIDKLVNKINEELIKDKEEKKVLKSKEDKLQDEIDRLKRRFDKLEEENKELKKRIIIKDKKIKKKIIKKKKVVNKKRVIQKKSYSPPIQTDNSSLDADDFITVTLAKGETLQILAKRYYGDSTRYTHIKNANRQIKVGKKLIIPGLKGE